MVKLDRNEWHRDFDRKPYHVEIAEKVFGQLRACALRMMHHFEGSGCILTAKSKQDSRTARMVLHVTSDVIHALVQSNPQGLGGLVKGPAHISSPDWLAIRTELNGVIFRCKLAMISHETYSSDSAMVRSPTRLAQSRSPAPIDCPTSVVPAIPRPTAGM